MHILKYIKQYITDVSIIWTSLSIISSILSFVTNKSINDNNEFILISMDISNNNINYTRNAAVRSKFKYILRQLSDILTVPSESITILKPFTTSNRVCIKFILNTKTYKESNNQLLRKNDLNSINNEVLKVSKLMNDPSNINKLTQQFNKSWHLDETTKIINIDVKYLESKNRQKHTVNIQMQNSSVNNHNNQANIIKSINDPINEGIMNNNDNNIETQGYLYESENSNDNDNNEGLNNTTLVYKQE